MPLLSVLLRDKQKQEKQPDSQTMEMPYNEKRQRLRNADGELRDQVSQMDATVTSLR